MELPFGVYNTSFQQELAIVRTRSQWILVCLALIIAFTLPTLMPGDWLSWTTMVAIYAVAVLGLHVLLGVTGLFSMGHGAIMAVGAYSAAVLGTSYGWPAWATLPVAGLAAGVMGILFAIPALRIKGFYLVMVTMAAQFVITWAITKFSWTGGMRGMGVPDLLIGGHRIGDVGLCWLALIVLVAMIVLVKNVQRTNIGRQFMAMRDNELAAEVMGINLFRVKILAFFIGCFVAGISGWVWAYFIGHVSAEQFNFMLSMKFLGMLVVGGLGSTTGAVLGTVVIMLVEKSTDYINPLLAGLPGIGANLGPSLSLILFAGMVILFIILEPRGLYDRVQRIRLWFHLHPFSF